MSDAQEVYQHLLKKGISEDEIEDAIKKKEHKFGGFITKEGALYLIAKEYGLNIHSSNVDGEIYQGYKNEIDYNEFTINISDVQENMTNIVLAGKIAHVFQLHEFNRKDGTLGVVGSFILKDRTGTIKIVLWGETTKIMQTEYFIIGTIIRVVNGYAKCGLNDQLEVHLAKQGKIILQPEDLSKNKYKEIDKIKIEHQEIENSGYQMEKTTPIKNIRQLLKQDGFIHSVSGYIHINELKEFEKENGEESFLLKCSLSDETGEIMVNIWGMQAIEILRIIEEGAAIKLINVYLRNNSYSGEKELQFTKKSVLEFI
ncbi:MAG: hypothetical protein EU547_04675 [Promethearchaeota archaeon]|nr:MAG: hypothetical protein EU547_04675 [Candidatus Lokiarchaeota archaeon]